MGNSVSVKSSRDTGKELLLRSKNENGLLIGDSLPGDSRNPLCLSIVARDMPYERLVLR